MLPKLVAVILLLLASARFAAADGCKFDRRGRTVPEREQRALIAWADGIETLHVATLADATTEGSVWIVPVRAAPTAVRAEPVDEFPVVPYYELLTERVNEQLRTSIAVAAMLDSGGLCCPFFMPGCSDLANKAIEASRVERLGMVVTVVSAESRAALEAYLDEQGVDRLAANLAPLAPYFGKADYTLVCGWVKPGERVTATGLKVVFPSPTLWFPLLPTRAYTNEVETVVYTRGFVKPASGCDLPALKCEFVYGAVVPAGIQSAFKKDRYGRPYGAEFERLTRVTLTADPRAWDRDLELVPGATPIGTVSLALTGRVGSLSLLWASLLGALLGPAIPLCTVPRRERRWSDFVAGVLAGAAIALTIWSSLLVFTTWRNYRFRGRPNRPLAYLVMPIFAIVHFGIALAVCRALIAWISTNE